MIPKITHSRSQLHFHFNNPSDDGKYSLYLSKDTYPELFEAAHPDIVALAPRGWHKGKMSGLWFPELDEDDGETIQQWCDRFHRYVLLGLNPHIKPHFDDELDFCLALDFNRSGPSGPRTPLGEAEYQIKYQGDATQLVVLKTALVDAFGDLPLPTEADVAISTVPTDPGNPNIARKLGKAVAKARELDFIRSDLLCDKSAMKGLSVDQKIPEWQKFYDAEGCVELHGDVMGRTIVVVDDLYQSGATLWCYAKYLKSLGAEHVIGLVCVKSLRDTDNQ